MSEKNPPVPSFEPIDEELVQKISGGGCTADDINQLLASLKENYDNLVDFTSYVIERVITSTTN
jgi:hypothetical protein